MKKEVILLAILVVLTLGMTAGAAYQSQHRQNVRDAAVVKAQSATKSAQAEASMYKLDLTAANHQVQTVTTQKLETCATIKAHKLTDQYCQ